MTMFEEWFFDRYGEQPIAEDIGTLMKAVHEAENNLAIANLRYQMLYQWNLKKLAAEDAWKMAGYRL